MSRAATATKLSSQMFWIQISILFLAFRLFFTYFQISGSAQRRRLKKICFIHICIWENPCTWQLNCTPAAYHWQKTSWCVLRKKITLRVLSTTAFIIQRYNLLFHTLWNVMGREAWDVAQLPVVLAVLSLVRDTDVRLVVCRTNVYLSKRMLAYWFSGTDTNTCA